MNNQEFLNVISCSFKEYLSSGSRSNKKLKILHGRIAMDLEQRLGAGFILKSLSETDEKSGEIELAGRYFNKKADITVENRDKIIAGVCVKYVMQNYAQNANNYFENMLGETANIRCSNIPLFQIFIIPEKIPYYQQNGTFKRWESFDGHYVEKYIRLSEDNVYAWFHVPVKTLLYVVCLPDYKGDPLNRDAYVAYYENMYNCKSSIPISASSTQYGAFGNNVIYNDYEQFADKVVHYIKYL